MSEFAMIITLGVILLSFIWFSIIAFFELYSTTKALEMRYRVLHSETRNWNRRCNCDK